jgi:hypothetical protein
LTTATLLIFSGRRDPTWELTVDEVATLARHLRDVGSAPELSTLGYRGFLVQSDDPGVPSRVIVRQVPELERFLLATGQGRLSPEIIRTVEEAIKLN